MRYLITGANGFIGSNFVSHLLHEDTEPQITIIVRRQSDLWRLQNCLDSISCVYWDSIEAESIVGQLPFQTYDVCAHFAWSGVSGNMRNAAQDQHSNLHLLYCLFSVVKATGIHTLLGLGSQAEYGRVEGSVDETHPLDPVTSYGQAKVKALAKTRDFCQANDIRLIWPRLFSLYGPGETTPWLIPSIVKSLLYQQKMDMTSCEQIRDYLHVQDASDAFLTAIQTPSAQGIYNIASGQGVVLKDLIKLIASRFGNSEILHLGARPQRADQTMEIVADTSHFHKACNWTPKVSLADGIAETVEWLRECRDKLT
jgi:nucleoside-diphosphate-sugar epimerase